MYRLFALALFAVISLRLCSASLGAEPEKFDDASLEFFEKEIRPVLAKRCYECHSGKSKKLQGGLRLDSRAAILAGGATERPIAEATERLPS